MVTEAGKELLRNTINTAKFHNKILEENEMWKQWELECGLTMMVSDDDILKKISKNHQCSKHRKRDKSRDRDVRDKCRSEVSPIPTAGPSKDISERWDHSGFQELYPDTIPIEKCSSSSSSKSHSNKQKKKKKKRHRKSSTSDNEIWEEFKRYKRSKTEKQKIKSRHAGSTSSGFDNHVKEWRKIKEKSKKSS